MQAAARAGDDHRLAAGQALGAVFGVAEAAPGHRDAVDPGLEGGGNAEVVHRRADHQHVGRQELLKHLLGLRRFGRVGLGQAASIEVGQGLQVQVAVLDLRPIRTRGPVCDDGRAQFAGHGVLAQGAGVDVQQLHVEVLVGGGDAASGATIDCCESGIKMI